MQQFLSKILKHAVELTLSRQISKRMNKHLDKFGDALEKTINERREAKAETRRETTRMTRPRAGQTLDASEPGLTKREEAFAKLAKAARPELIKMLIDLKFSDEVAERAVDTVMDEASMDLCRGDVSVQYLSTQALRRARSLRRQHGMKQRLQEQLVLDDNTDRDNQDNQDSRDDEEKED